MIKLNLYPPSGTVEDAKSLKFELDGIKDSSIRVRIENVTHNISSSVSSLQKTGEEKYMGFVDLTIPSHITQTSISVFAYVEKDNGDGTYNTIQICPAIYTVQDNIDISEDRVYASPSFIGQNDLCSVRVVGSSNSKKILSVNDKFYRLVLGDDGIGSISIKGRDIIGEDLNSVCQIPIYIYSEDDNFIKRTFTNSHLNIFPDSLSMHIDNIDERCDPTSDSYVEPGTWTLPDGCVTPPDPPVIPVVKPTIPPIGISTSCKEEEVNINEDSTCRIFSHSATLLNSGIAFHAYLSPDKTITDNDADGFNINKIFLTSHETSIDVQVIANRDVVVEPKEHGDNFTIHVQEDLWNSLDFLENTSIDDVYVVMFNRATGFQRVKIIGRDLDEYTGSYILIGEEQNSSIKINDWIFCVNSVFYHEEEFPNLYLDVNNNPYDLGYIYDDSNNILQVINISVASNSMYIGDNEESYIYIIAEALDDEKSHLFFNSLLIGKDSSVVRSSNGWIKITRGGNNNQYPVSRIGYDNNLHVIWESDRSGLKQIYYGVLGLSAVSPVCSAFSALIDKYSEFLSRGDVPFDYTDLNLLTEIGDGIYNPSQQIPEYSSSDLVSSNWNLYGAGGSISQTSGDSYINDLNISANALTEDAMAFNSLEIVDNYENPSVTEAIPYSQFNYQISFDLIATVTQTSSIATEYDGIIISDTEMNQLYKTWKDEFVLSTNQNVNGKPVYTKDGNEFTIGRVDSVFDKIVPIVGSYQHDGDNPSVDRFQIDIRKDSNNLKDFTLGLMFEKTRFEATNIYTSSEFTTDNPSDISYIDKEEHVIYTGKAKLVVLIKTEDTETDRSNYIIVREFPEKIDVTSNKSYVIISNYTKIDSDNVSVVMDTYQQIYENNFMGQLTLLIDSIPRFSQSFISTISSDYNYFDIGFGIPYGGYYIADKMSPSKMGIFDNIDVSLAFTNIEITSPTYSYNFDVINISSDIRDMTKLKVDDFNPSIDPYALSNLSIDLSGDEEIIYSSTFSENSGSNYSRLYDTSLADVISVSFNTLSIEDRIQITKSDGSVLYDSEFTVSNPLDFDIDVSSINSIYVNIFTGEGSTAYNYQIDFKKVSYAGYFSQIPITFEGINKSPSMCLGKCDDIHVSWQSNRDTKWNIYYSSSNDKLSPFRFETRITDTDSNSLKPSVSVNDNGTRLITWHDDRNGNYDIFAARSFEGYSCNDDKCKRSMADAFEYDIIECSISIDYEKTRGNYSMSLEFYNDIALDDLYKTIDLSESNKDRWYVDGSSPTLYYSPSGELSGFVFKYNGSSVISYIPDKEDKIFDRVLYVKLISEEVAEE
jgi:hypothetical protein